MLPPVCRELVQAGLIRTVYPYGDVMELVLIVGLGRREGDAGFGAAIGAGRAADRVAVLVVDAEDLEGSGLVVVWDVGCRLHDEFVGVVLVELDGDPVFVGGGVVPVVAQESQPAHWLADIVIEQNFTTEACLRVLVAGRRAALLVPLS